MDWKEKEVRKIEKKFIEENPGLELCVNDHVKKELKRRRALIEHKAEQYEKEKDSIKRGNKKDWTKDEKNFAEFEKNTNKSFNKHYNKRE